MSSTVDLHIHTTASDGSDPVPELAAKIAGSPIRLFSVTDHDTIAGALAMEELVPEGIHYIRGVEFSCVSPAGKCHILGYSYDPTHPALLAALEEGSRLRREKLERRIAHLRDRWGIELSDGEQQWLRSRKSPGKPHLGKLLADRGLATDRSAAIKTYLSGVPGRDRIEAGTAIRAIEASGGLAVWAHPLGGEGEVRLTADRFEEQLQTLLGYGLQGMECWYSRYCLDEVRFLLDRAQARGLTVTGGSDYHGTNKKDLKLGQLNAENIPVSGISPIVLGREEWYNL